MILNEYVNITFEILYLQSKKVTFFLTLTENMLQHYLKYYLLILHFVMFNKCLKILNLKRKK